MYVYPFSFRVNAGPVLPEYPFAVIIFTGRTWCINEYTGPVNPLGPVNFCCAIKSYSSVPSAPVGPTCHPPTNPDSSDVSSGPILINGVANPFVVYMISLLSY